MLSTKRGWPERRSSLHEDECGRSDHQRRAGTTVTQSPSRSLQTRSRTASDKQAGEDC